MSRQDAIRGNAALALSAACKNDWATANRAASKVADTYGGDAVITMMLGWIDTAIYHVLPEGMGDKPVRLAFLCLDTGEINTADNVPPATAWAGRLIAARLADDQATFTALLQAVPMDGQPEHLTALLHACAEAINNPSLTRTGGTR